MHELSAAWQFWLRRLNLSVTARCSRRSGPPAFAAGCSRCCQLFGAGTTHSAVITITIITKAGSVLGSLFVMPLLLYCPCCWLTAILSSSSYIIFPHYNWALPLSAVLTLWMTVNFIKDALLLIYLKSNPLTTVSGFDYQNETGNRQ